jgi:hypothetical protein
MPTVLDVGGFQVRNGDQPLGIRKLHGMRTSDVVTAFRLVEANVAMLIEQWRRYHG